MSSVTEVKLLTLLNVSAVRRPRERDTPGGHRGSPSLSRNNSESLDGFVQTSGSGPSAESPLAGQGKNGGSKKRRRSVMFGGVIGPSGSGLKVKKGVLESNGNGRDEEDGIQMIKGKGKSGIDSTGETVTSGSEGLDHLAVENEEEDDGPQASTSAESDMFNIHFGVVPPVLNLENTAAAEKNEWKSEKKILKGFERVVELQIGGGVGKERENLSTRITPAILTSLQSASTLPTHFTTALSHLGSYQDFYLHSLDGEADGSEKSLLGEQKESMRKAAVVHSLNHVLKTRRKIIKNNERLAQASASNDPSSSLPEPRDQSFTRPKILFLLPLRSLALHYLKTHLFPLAPPGTQIENLRPFISSFSLPSEAGEDSLDQPSATSNFALDHLVNFRGNSDDNFRFGVKFTRKAWRVVMMPANEEKLVACDILVASPLGIKMAAEREDSTDLLSSIEICVADGLDVMQMQNWDHVQFVFSHMNKIPKSPHGCDFSRVKPWYLDSQAHYLRQTILLSRYDTPESRSLFHKHCHNLQGKIRTDRSDYQGLLGNIRPGVRQIFERFDLEGGRGVGADAAVEEVEQRLEWFTKKTVPALLRSAVSRQNTLIVVPSYFDYIRVVNHLRKADVVSYAAISEYSSNAEISRARTLFFKGKKAFLLVTERFHFYRRYRIRGAKTLVFYSLPDHAQFYSEYLQTPFLPSKSLKEEKEELEVEVDEAEISSRVLFSRFDFLKLERVVGSVNARRMLGSGEGRFEFI